MSKVLIVGAGGVGSVVTHKCAQMPDVFEHIVLASRTLAPLREDPRRGARAARGARSTSPRSTPTTSRPTVALIERERARPVDQRRAALPGPAAHGRVPARPASTTSTPPTTSRPTWPSSSTSGSGPTASASRTPGRMALLGSGFDPGVTNVFCALRAEAPVRRDPHDRHRRLQRRRATARRSRRTSTPRSTSARSPSAAATGRTARGTRPTRCRSRWTSTIPGVGERKSYLLYHEELESLVQNIPGLQPHPLLDDVLRRTTSRTCGCCRTSA